MLSSLLLRRRRDSASGASRLSSRSAFVADVADFLQSAPSVHNAEAATCQARCAGDGVSLSQPVDAAGEVQRLALTDLLRSSLDQEDSAGFSLVYQPQINLRTQEMDSVEALCRWTGPDGCAIAPGTFLPLLEEAGLMKRLTSWVLHTAAAQAAVWRRSGHRVTVAVNISASVMDADLLPLISDCLTLNGLPAEAIKLEITEDLLVGQQERVLQVLHSICDLGCSISIDDFGTGYSSFAYLRYLPVSELKIDQAFVRPMLHDVRARSLVESIIDLAHRLDLTVVAEGVEDARTVEQLRAMGSDVAQGYHLGLPWSPADLELHMAMAASVAPGRWQSTVGVRVNRAWSCEAGAQAG